MGFLKKLKKNVSFTWVIVAAFVFFLIYSIKHPPTRKNSKGDTAETAREAGATQETLKAKRDALMEKIRGIKIPLEAIDKKNLPAVIAEIRKNGVNVVLFGLNDSPVETAEGKNAETLSLPKALECLNHDVGIEYRVESDAILIAAENAPMDPLETRTFPCPPDTEIDRNPIPTLKKLGVRFPNGARAAFFDTYGELTVRNVPEELDKIKTLMNTNVPISIRISWKTVDIPEKEYRKARKRRGGLLPSEFWKRAIESGLAELVESQNVLTMDGEEADVRSVREIYFPESWSDGAPVEPAADENGEKDGNGKKSADSSSGGGPTIIEQSPFPEFEESTDLGLRLVVTPTVAPDGKTISIACVPIPQRFAGWTRLPSGIRTPELKTRIISTQTTMRNGELTPISSSLITKTDRKTEKPTRVRRVELLSAMIENPNGTAFDDKRGTTPNHLPKTDWQQKLAAAEIAEVNIEATGAEALDAILKKLSAACRDANLTCKFISLVETTDTPKKVSIHLKHTNAFDLARYASAQTGWILQSTADGRIAVMDTNTNYNYSFTTTPQGALALKLDTPRGRTITLELPTSGKMSNDFPRKTGDGDAFSIATACHGLIGNLYNDEFPSRITTELSIVSISQKDLEELIGVRAARVGPINEKQLEKILESPKSRIIGSSSTITKPGEEAIAANVTMKYFPDAWIEPETTIDDNGGLSPIAPIPEFGESTELGTRLEVTPEQFSANEMILCLNLQNVEQLGDIEYDYELKITLPDGRSEKRHSIVKMPIIGRNYIAAGVFAASGHAVLAGRTMASFPWNGEMKPFDDTKPVPPEKTRNILFIVKANIQNADGGPMWTSAEIFEYILKKIKEAAIEKL